MKMNRSMALLRSVKSLCAYNKICISNSFEKLVRRSGRDEAETPAGRFLSGPSKQGQSMKKCSVSSMPSLVGHIEFKVSLKMCLNL